MINTYGEKVSAAKSKGKGRGKKESLHFNEIIFTTQISGLRKKRLVP